MSGDARWQSADLLLCGEIARENVSNELIRRYYVRFVATIPPLHLLTHFSFSPLDFASKLCVKNLFFFISNQNVLLNVLLKLFYFVK